MDFVTLMWVTTIAFAPVSVGLATITLSKNSMSLAKYFGLTVVLVVSQIALGFVENNYSMPDWWHWSLIGLGTGILVTMILAGFKGNALSTSSYASILVFISAFPWSFSALVSLVAFMSVLATFFGVGFYKTGKAFKEIGVSRIPHNSVHRYLSKDELEIYNRVSKVMYSNLFLVVVGASFIAYIAEIVFELG